MRHCYKHILGTTKEQHVYIELDHLLQAAAVAPEINVLAVCKCILFRCHRQPTDSFLALLWEVPKEVLSVKIGIYIVGPVAGI